jgi:hypothetical protein
MLAPHLLLDDFSSPSAPPPVLLLNPRLSGHGLTRQRRHGLTRQAVEAVRGDCAWGIQACVLPVRPRHALPVCVPHAPLSAVGAQSNAQRVTPAMEETYTQEYAFDVTKAYACVVCVS